MATCGPLVKCLLGCESFHVMDDVNDRPGFDSHGVLNIDEGAKGKRGLVFVRLQ